MNKIVVLFTASLLVITGSSLASVTTFSAGDLQDLPHSSWFTWGINYTPTSGETITSAVLTYRNIYDWRVEPGDNLATHLLDNPASGTKIGTDVDNGTDYFAGQGVLVGNWNDPQGGRPRNFDLVYTFNADLLAELNAYAATVPGSGKANFGLGIDPDCHYYNSGVTLVITTSPISIVPAPGAVLLGGIGVSIVGWMRRRRTL